MKRFLAIGLVVLLALVCVNSTEAATATITVKDADTLIPIQDARVRLYNATGQQVVFEDYTDYDGMVLVEGLAAGTYLCLTTRNGYQDAYTFALIIDGFANGVFLEPLVVPAATSITVLSAGSETLLASASVKIYTIAGQIVFSGITDGEGRVEFSLPTGIYAYAITKDGYRNATDQFFANGQNIDVYLQEIKIKRKLAAPMALP